MLNRLLTIITHYETVIPKGTLGDIIPLSHIATDGAFLWHPATSASALPYDCVSNKHVGMFSQ